MSALSRRRALTAPPPPVQLWPPVPEREPQRSPLMFADNSRRAEQPRQVPALRRPAGVVVASLLEALVLARLRAYDWRASAVSLFDLFARVAVQIFLPLSIATPLIALAYRHRLGHDRARRLGGAARALHRPGVLLLLVPPRRAPRALVLVQPRGASLAERAQPGGGLSHRLDWASCTGSAALLRAADLARLRRRASCFAMLSLNLLYQFWIHATWIPQARLARIRAEHAVGAPRPPRRQPRVPRRQLRRRADRLRPPVRHLPSPSATTCRAATAWSSRWPATTRSASSSTSGARSGATCSRRAACAPCRASVHAARLEPARPRRDHRGDARRRGGRPRAERRYRPRPRTRRRPARRSTGTLASRAWSTSAHPRSLSAAPGPTQAAGAPAALAILARPMSELAPRCGAAAPSPSFPTPTRARPR